MASVEVTTTPTALPGIEAGKEYYLENQGTEDVYLALATAAPPAASHDRVILESRDRAPIKGGYAKVDAGDSMFVWTPQRTSRVFYIEGN